MTYDEAVEFVDSTKKIWKYLRVRKYPQSDAGAWKCAGAAAHHPCSGYEWKGFSLCPFYPRH